ncbi:HAD-IIB family hydrolase [Paenibacillus sp. GCM10027627]|uniref:HAD-IIB family hydrolase n=1 Tax=unclassified Paenibacillus TaxID=185978 RepID=UPI0036423437
MKFVFDLDGTICFKGKPLSHLMVKALDSLVEKGFDLVFASARPIRDLLPILPPHLQQCLMVGGNGAFMAEGGRIVSTVSFDSNTADAIMALIHKYEADYLVDSRWDYSFSGSLDHPIRVNIDPEQRAKAVPLEQLNEMVKAVILRSFNQQEVMEELKKLPVVLYRHGNEDIIDISPQHINKWTGLQKLGVMSGEFIAFGNDANDISMFQHAVHSVCVGEHPELLRVATEQVQSDEGAVIEKISELQMLLSQGA